MKHSWAPERLDFNTEFYKVQVIGLFIAQDFPGGPKLFLLIFSKIENVIFGLNSIFF